MTKLTLIIYSENKLLPGTAMSIRWSVKEMRRHVQSVIIRRIVALEWILVECVIEYKHCTLFRFSK